MKAKRIFLILSLLGLFLLSGCTIAILNETPETLPTNPSGIYTLTARTALTDSLVKRDSLKTFIVIDGSKEALTPRPEGGGFYEYDYAIPEGRNEARYYFLMEYQLHKDKEPNLIHKRQSELSTLKLIDRYTISLDVNRAPIGTELALFGRGFSRADTVFVGQSAAETRYLTSNTLQFLVPPVEAGKRYKVEVRSGANREAAGLLKVDPSLPLRVVPSELDMQTGQNQALLFQLENPAPNGGQHIEVTTDIPNSVIMPEVVIAAGQRTVSITLQAGVSGIGKLYIQAPGMREIVIPISVQ
jgi:hypothetical protein